jgi:peptide/nickel transport system permease protein
MDKALNILACAGLSVPNFLLCLLLLALASQVNFLPLGGMKSVFYEEMSWPGKIADVAWHMIIPVTVTALSSFSFLFRVARGQALEIADKDFVVFLRTLRVPENTIIYKHIARNAVNPMVTLFGLELPALFSGVALVEIFTGWPGLGQVLLQAVRAQDLFLVLGNTIIVALLLIAGNLLADLALVMIDPRIRMVNP